MLPTSDMTTLQISFSRGCLAREDNYLFSLRSCTSTLSDFSGLVMIFKIVIRLHFLKHLWPTTVINIPLDIAVLESILENSWRLPSWIIFLTWLLFHCYRSEKIVLERDTKNGCVTMLNRSIGERGVATAMGIGTIQAEGSPVKSSLGVMQGKGKLIISRNRKHRGNCIMSDGVSIVSRQKQVVMRRTAPRVQTKRSQALNCQVHFWRTPTLSVVWWSNTANPRKHVFQRNGGVCILLRMTRSFQLCTFTGRAPTCWGGTDALLTSPLTIPPAPSSMLSFSTGRSLSAWREQGQATGTPVPMNCEWLLTLN